MYIGQSAGECLPPVMLGRRCRFRDCTAVGVSELAIHDDRLRYSPSQHYGKVLRFAAQKGTIGMTYLQQDMPFSKSGVVPDIIMNPHAIPSRMTIGQLMECIMGKACCHIGSYGDSTPFTDCSVESIAKVLEKSGMERYGNEILYNGRTGEMMHTEIFIGPTYYQRLKHMVSDKMHCLTSDHDVLTKDGWKPIAEVTMVDEVATLHGERLVYEHPKAVLSFPDFHGKMYHIKNQAIDLNVTYNHRMYVSTSNEESGLWSDYQLIPAEEIVGKQVRYKKDAMWDVPDYQFILPSNEETMNMDAWLTFFGIWIVNRMTADQVEIGLYKQEVRDALIPALAKLGYTFTVDETLCTIQNPQLWLYLSMAASRKILPEWVWSLSAQQCQKLIYAMQLADGTSDEDISCYHTTSDVVADQVMRLCLHAGYTSNKQFHSYIENKIDVDYWKITIYKNRGHVTTEHAQEEIYDFQGPVYCLQVSTEVFMVRRNGKAVWTGNSRGSNGPVVLITRQPAEGRARNGGLRFGEMERDALVAHGASAFLKERMMDTSDNYRVFICRKCGLLCTANPEKNIFKCTQCKNSADIVQVRIPYSMKLLIQELMTMGVAPRISV